MAFVLPDLGRLSLSTRPTCPTGVGGGGGGGAEDEQKAREKAAREAVVGDNNLLGEILTALNNGHRDDACRMVQMWCATHKDACTEDTWRHMRDLIFPAFRNHAHGLRAKHHLLVLCRRWNRGRLDRYLAALQAAKARGNLVIPKLNGDEGAEEHDERLYKAIELFLRTSHDFYMEDAGDFQHNRPRVFDGYDVYWFCAWALEFDPDPLLWAIKAGYVHLNYHLAAPDRFWNQHPEGPMRFFEGQAFCFFPPTTLLGLAILWPTNGEVLKLVRLILDTGVSPNATGIRPHRFVRGDALLENDVLRPRDEDGIEALALFHITHFLHETYRYTGTYYRRHERVMPGLVNLLDLKPIYAELHKYGADMYKAALM